VTTSWMDLSFSLDLNNEIALSYVANAVTALAEVAKTPHDSFDVFLSQTGQQILWINRGSKRLRQVTVPPPWLRPQPTQQIFRGPNCKLSHNC